MPRHRISLPAVSDSALAVVDREGFDALTLSMVAAELDVVPSALYTHVDGLDGLRYLVAVTATGNLTHTLNASAIGVGGDSALAAMGAAYREFALSYPGRFASTLLPPRSDNDDLAAANRDLLHIFVLVYGAMGFDPDQAHLAARSTRSAIHGFLALEHSAGTTAAHAAEYQHLLDTLQNGLTRA